MEGENYTHTHLTRRGARGSLLALAEKRVALWLLIRHFRGAAKQMNGSTNNALLFMNFIWQKSKEWKWRGKERGETVLSVSEVNQLWVGATQAAKKSFLLATGLAKSQTISREANKSLALLQRAVGGGRKKALYIYSIYIYMIPGTHCVCRN